LALLSRKKRFFLVKVLGLLSIIRWPNVLFTVLAQYIAAIYIFTPSKGHWEVLKDFELHFIVLASSFIVAAGFIINSFYDLEKDLINRPHKALFDRIVSKSFCLNTYFVLNGLGLIFAFFASWRVFIFFAAFSFGLWFYSHKLKKITIVRELTASILSVLSVFSIVLYYQHINWIILLYGGLFMCMLLNREIIKNLKNIDGDIAVGNKSISTQWGVKVSKNIFGTVSVIMVGALLTFHHASEGNYVLAYTLLISLLILLSWGILITSNRKKQLFWAHRLYKIMMAASVLYLIVY
jgi:4-hydroxybenzoate polyprenyltransferase